MENQEEEFYKCQLPFKEISIQLMPWTSRFSIYLSKDTLMTFSISLGQEEIHLSHGKLPLKCAFARITSKNSVKSLWSNVNQI